MSAHESIKFNLKNLISNECGLKKPGRCRIAGGPDY